jgi:hypothetical protein
LLKKITRNGTSFGNNSLWGGTGNFNLDDAVNGVWLPKKLHPSDHLTEGYKEKVWAKLNNILNPDNNPTKEKVLNEIKDMRQEILTGRGQGEKLKLNNSWDDADVGKYFDEIEKMTGLYSSL